MASELNISEQKFKTIALRGKVDLCINDFEGLEFETFYKFTTQTLTLKLFALHEEGIKNGTTLSESIASLVQELKEHHKEYKASVSAVSDSGAHNHTWRLR